MSLAVVVKPNADFSSGNITRALLNQAAKPTVAVAGSIGTEEIEALSITEGKIADKTLTGSKLADTTVGIGKLANLGRGNVLVGQAKSEDDNIDGGDTVTLKLPENGFLVGDGNDVKAMIFDNSSSGAINMSQYTDSSTGDTSFKFDLRNLGVRSAHIASRSINLSKLSPNGGTPVTEAATYSTLPTYDGTAQPDGTNYGLATLTSSEPTVAGVATTGLTLKSNGTAGPLSFGATAYKVLDATSEIGFAPSTEVYSVAINHLLVDKDDNGVVPSYVRCVLRCTDTNGDGGYAENDEVDFSSIMRGYGGQDENSSFWANATQVGLSMASNDVVLYVANKTASKTVAQLDETKWTVRFYVSP